MLYASLKIWHVRASVLTPGEAFLETEEHSTGAARGQRALSASLRAVLPLEGGGAAARIFTV